MTARHARNDAASLLLEIEGRRVVSDAVPLFGLDDARRIAEALSTGHISARRMARALDSSFEDMDATFAHHGLGYRIGL